MPVSRPFESSGGPRLPGPLAAPSTVAVVSSTGCTGFGRRGLVAYGSSGEREAGRGRDGEDGDVRRVRRGRRRSARRRRARSRPPPAARGRGRAAATAAPRAERAPRARAVVDRCASSEATAARPRAGCATPGRRAGRSGPRFRPRPPTSTAAGHADRAPGRPADGEPEQRAGARARRSRRARLRARRAGRRAAAPERDQRGRRDDRVERGEPERVVPERQDGHGEAEGERRRGSERSVISAAAAAIPSGQPAGKNGSACARDPGGCASAGGCRDPLRGLLQLVHGPGRRCGAAAPRPAAHGEAQLACRPAHGRRSQPACRLAQRARERRGGGTAAGRDRERAVDARDDRARQVGPLLAERRRALARSPSPCRGACRPRTGGSRPAPPRAGRRPPRRRRPGRPASPRSRSGEM